jgi:predicted Zn-dependent peptidase
MIGCRAYSYVDPRRMALYLLNNMLGGPGMNARLNLSLRERHGLVYTVESAMAAYSDTGVWSVYFGCDHHDISRCRRLVRRELDRMITRRLSMSQLAAAKRQLKGQIAIGCDNHEQFALDFGRSFLHHGQERDLETLFARIDAVTAEDIQQVAGELFPADNLTTLIIS